MSRFAEWSEVIEERMNRADNCSALLDTRDEDWRLATAYAFNLTFETFQRRGIDLPRVTRPMVVGTALVVVAAFGWLMIMISALRFAPIQVAVVLFPLLVFWVLYSRILASLGLPLKGLDKKVIGGGLGMLVLSNAPRILGENVVAVATVETIVKTLVTLILATCLAACTMAWTRASFRIRFNALASISPTKPKIEDGHRVLHSMINIANAISQLRKAHRAGPETYENTRLLLGTTPGNTLYGSHPLDLNDSRFEADLQILLAGDFPKMQAGS